MTQTGLPSLVLAMAAPAAGDSSPWVQLIPFALVLAIFYFLILLHVSRGVRWDSDHVVVLNDDLEAIGQELVRGDYLARTHIGLDYFDASINRVAAWVIGTRNMVKSLLIARLAPVPRLRELELAGDFAAAVTQEKKVQAFLDNLKVNDRVITTSGIYGQVTRLGEQSVQLQIADKVRIEVSRAAVGGFQGQDPVAPDASGQ